MSQIYHFFKNGAAFRFQPLSTGLGSDLKNFFLCPCVACYNII